MMWECGVPIDIRVKAVKFEPANFLGVEQLTRLSHDLVIWAAPGADF